MHINPFNKQEYRAINTAYIDLYLAYLSCKVSRFENKFP
jgi:hypothetical protein